LNICPTIYKLIFQFQKELNISLWIIEHKNKFLLLNFLVDVIFNSVTFIDKYSPKQILVEDGESFEICNYKENFYIIFLIIFKFMEIFLLLFLVFIERNIEEIMYDIKVIVPVIYMDIFSFILIIVFNIIEIKYYKIIFIILAINTSIISIINFIFFIYW